MFRIEWQEDSCANMCTEAIFMSKQSENGICLTTGEWLNKLYFFMMKDYVAIKEYLHRGSHWGMVATQM